MRKFGLLALIAPTVIAASVVAAPAFALQAGNSAYPTASSALSAEITSKLDTKNATVGEAVTCQNHRRRLHFGNGTNSPQGRNPHRKGHGSTIQVLRRRNRSGDHLL